MVITKNSEIQGGGGLPISKLLIHFYVPLLSMHCTKFHDLDSRFA